MYKNIHNFLIRSNYSEHTYLHKGVVFQKEWRKQVPKFLFNSGVALCCVLIIPK